MLDQNYWERVAADRKSQARCFRRGKAASLKTAPIIIQSLRGGGNKPSATLVSSPGLIFTITSFIRAISSISAFKELAVAINLNQSASVGSVGSAATVSATAKICYR